MVECNKMKGKLSDSQLNNLKTAAKNLTLRMNIKMCNGSNLRLELLTTRQKTKLRNAY